MDLLISHQGHNFLVLPVYDSGVGTLLLLLARYRGLSLSGSGISS